MEHCKEPEDGSAYGISDVSSGGIADQFMCNLNYSRGVHEPGKSVGVGVGTVPMHAIGKVI